MKLEDFLMKFFRMDQSEPCEHKWSPWKARSTTKSRMVNGVPMFKFIHHYQQRSCKVCGKIEQEDLENPGE